MLNYSKIYYTLIVIHFLDCLKLNGFGFVQFEDASDAQKAITSENGAFYKGKNIGELSGALNLWSQL